MFERKFAFSLVVFLATHGNFTLIFTAFAILWIGFFFFQNGFPNPFIVHSRSSFLFEPNLYISVMVFSFSVFVVFVLFLSLFFFYCFNPDVRLARQRRLFSGNLLAILRFFA